MGAVFFLSAHTAAGATVEGHPDVPPIAGFEYRTGKYLDLGSREFPAAVRGAMRTRTVTGRYWELSYANRNPARVYSPLEIMTHYKDLVRRKGGKVLQEREPKMDFVVPGAAGTVWVNLHTWDNYFSLEIVEEPVPYAVAPSRPVEPSRPVMPSAAQIESIKRGLARLKTQVDQVRKQVQVLGRERRDIQRANSLIQQLEASTSKLNDDGKRVLGQMRGIGMLPQGDWEIINGLLREIQRAIPKMTLPPDPWAPPDDTGTADDTSIPCSHQTNCEACCHDRFADPFEIDYCVTKCHVDSLQDEMKDWQEEMMGWIRNAGRI
jgi:hypothetical protein